MAFAILFDRCPNVAVVLGLARYFYREDATRLHRTQLTCGKPARITDKKSGNRRSRG